MTASTTLAVIKLEERGAYVKHLSGPGSQFLPRVGNNRPWVAHITGSCARYGLERDFLYPFIDYRDASRSGRSGIVHYHFVADGYYDVYAVLSAKRTRRYFLRCEAGELHEVEREEINAWIATIES